MVKYPASALRSIPRLELEYLSSLNFDQLFNLLGIIIKKADTHDKGQLFY